MIFMDFSIVYRLLSPVIAGLGSILKWVQASFWPRINAKICRSFIWDETDTSLLEACLNFQCFCWTLSNLISGDTRCNKAGQVGRREAGKIRLGQRNQVSGGKRQGSAWSGLAQAWTRCCLEGAWSPFNSRRAWLLILMIALYEHLFVARCLKMLNVSVMQSNVSAPAFSSRAGGRGKATIQ